MEEIKLSIEEQIEVLTLSKKMLINDCTLDVNRFKGVCVCVHSVVYTEKGIKELKSFSYGDEKLVINGFSFENAKLLAVKYGFDIPTGYDDGYWWTDRTSLDRWVKPRVAFIDALIAELLLY